MELRGFYDLSGKSRSGEGDDILAGFWISLGLKSIFFMKKMDFNKNIQ